jgi:hypothetical protein
MNEFCGSLNIAANGWGCGKCATTQPSESKNNYSWRINYTLGYRAFNIRLMKYSEHTIKQRSKKDISRKQYERFEGVFKTKFGKYVVRIKKGNAYKTIGQYDSEAKANEVFALNAL